MMRRAHQQGQAPRLEPEALHGLTVPGLLHQRAAWHPNRLALSVPSARGPRDRLSYAQLVRRMEALAAELHRLGLRPGARVMLLLSNDHAREGVLTALACWRLGAAVAPVNLRASDEELRHAMGLVEPAMVVVAAADLARFATLGTPARPLVTGGDAGSATPWPEPEALAAADEAPVPLPDPEALSCLLFTSGTTARSKAVMHCHRSQLFTGYAISGAVGLRPDDVYQGAWPLFTSSVLNMACMGGWVAGCSVALEGAARDEETRLALIAAERATVYHGVTSVLHFLIDAYRPERHDLSSVRRIAYGGATMPAEVIDKMRRRLPSADQLHIWGMTESGPAGTFLPPHYLPRKAGCIGGPMPLCAVRAVDAGGAPLPVGEAGELAFAGPSMAQGYFRNPEATAAAFRDGWLMTGDMVRMDAEGHFHFVDRLKDIINRGGVKISSAAVEEVLYRHPAVQEAAVVAAPHDRLGEDVAACVVLHPGAAVEPDTLETHCRALLADFQCPRRWLFLDALPKNPMGKILKRDLREMLERAPQPTGSGG